MRLIEIVNPATEALPRSCELAPRRGLLAGRRVGFLANGKANSRLLLEMVEAAMREAAGEVQAVHIDKEHSGIAVDLGALAGCAAVATAIGD
jgi:hypothetical protein